MIGLGGKVAIALGAAAVASLGLAIGLAHASPSPSPAPPKLPPPPVPPSPSRPTPSTPTPATPAGPSAAVTWTPAPAQITTGTRVRISVAADDLAVLAQSIGAAADYNGWLDILVNPVVQSALQTPTLNVWGPNPSGDGTMYPGPLPADWPQDDTNWATEYHAEFQYNGRQPLVLAQFPIPLQAWIATPTA